MNGRQMLAEFLAKGTKQNEFADQVQCSAAHLCLFLKGKRRMSIALAKRVSAATGGEVPIRALVPAEVAEFIEAA